VVPAPARRFRAQVRLAKDEPAKGHAPLPPASATGSRRARGRRRGWSSGRWQSVFAVELDGRAIAAGGQLDGEFSAPRPKRSRQHRARRARAVAPAAGRPEPVSRRCDGWSRPAASACGRRLFRLTPGMGLATELLGGLASAASIELLHNRDSGPTTMSTRDAPARGATVEPPRDRSEHRRRDYYFAKATRLIAEIGNRSVTSTIAEALEAICASQIDDVRAARAFPGDHDSSYESYWKDRRAFSRQPAPRARCFPRRALRSSKRCAGRRPGRGRVPDGGHMVDFSRAQASPWPGHPPAGALSDLLSMRPKTARSDPRCGACSQARWGMRGSRVAALVNEQRRPGEIKGEAQALVEKHSRARDDRAGRATPILISLARSVRRPKTS